MGDARDRVRRRIDRSILLRLRIYAALFVVLAVIAVVDTVRAGAGAVPPVLGGFALGVVVGLVASRMFRLSWDTVSGRVIGAIDAAGAVVLVLYVLFSVFRTALLDVWLDGAVLTAAAVAALTGAMLGQVVGTGRGIAEVLRAVVGAGEPRPTGT